MYKIIFAQNNDETRWNDFVYLHEESGPYHNFSWKTAVEKAYRHKAYYLIAENDRKQIFGVLPLFHVKPPLLKGSLISLPFCDYGGVLALTDEVSGELIKYSIPLADSLKAKLEIRCVKPETILSYKTSLGVMSHKVRMVLELPDSSQNLMKGFKSKLRSQIKKPQKEGLIFRIGAMNLFEDFYNVFHVNMRDLGSPVHSKKMIKNILESYGKSVFVGVVYKDDIPLSAGIAIGQKELITIPWASALAKYSRMSPNMLLYWGFLEFASDNGFKVFDFGRSTPEEGTYRFKKQWGAVPHPLYWYIEGFSDVDSNNPFKILFREKIKLVWSKLPQKFVDIAGPLIRRYITL
jgi:serine/alanine adding enzyme